MNPKTCMQAKRSLTLLAIGTMLACAGCWKERIVWSPDGTRAAVLGNKGLYLAAGDGHLSEPQVPDVYLVRWLPDSRGLILARTIEVRNWSDVVPFIAPERSQIEAEANDLLQSKSTDSLSKQIDAAKNKKLLRLCLRDTHAEAVKAKLSSEEWNDLTKEGVEVSEIVLAHVADDKVIVDRTRFARYGDVQDIRVAPRGDSVLLTQDPVLSGESGRLLVMLLAGDEPPVSVARNPAVYPDWSPDGRSVVYVEGGAKATPEDVVLGVLTRREVKDEQGKIHLAEKCDYLAGLMYNTMARVRCLRDGRILFNAVEITLPMAKSDYGDGLREQLFALDLARQSTLVRLIPRAHEQNAPQGLTFFEPSPDETQILLAGSDGKVCVLSIASGEFETVQEDGKPSFEGLPAWRRGGEFTYIKRMPNINDKPPARKGEVVLHRASEKEVIWSQSWTEAALSDVAKTNSE